MTIKPLDVVEQALPGLLPGAVPLTEHKLLLQGAEETFHRGVVPTVALATHAAPEAMLGQ